MLPVLTEGHGPLAGQPGGKLFVGLHQSIAPHAHDYGAELIEYIVCPVGLGCDFRIQPDERLAHPSLHQNFLWLAGYISGLHIAPPDAGSTVGCMRPPELIVACASDRTGQPVANIGFDCVGFGEDHHATSSPFNM